MEEGRESEGIGKKMRKRGDGKKRRKGRRIRKKEKVETGRGEKEEGEDR